MSIRLTLFILLAIVSLLAPLQAFLLCALVYVFFWEGYELLAIGIFIDSVFGTTVLSFLYTLSIGGLLLGFALIRPYLSWYNTQV